MMARLVLVIELLIAGLGVASRAARAEMPKSIQHELERLGSTLSPQADRATLEIYTREARKGAKSGVKTTRDLAYGSHALQVLDVYQLEGKTGVPVVMFVHGGGYVGGNKIVNGELFANVPTYFARNGVLGVSINYRLAPGAPWPAAAQDVGAAVAWLRQNAATYGGNPERMFVFGYSAGATHVASYVFDRSLQPASGSGVAGAILLSGVYQVQPSAAATVADNVKAYFGADPSQWPARSPFTHVPGSTVRVFVAGAELDPPFLFRGTDSLKQALCARDGNCPRFVRLAHHNHYSTAMSFNSSDDDLGQALLEFIREGG